MSVSAEPRTPEAAEQRRGEARSRGRRAAERAAHWVEAHLSEFYGACWSLNLQHSPVQMAGCPLQLNSQPQPRKLCQFKLVLLGESAVGKSSLVLRFVKGQFQEYQESTIGAAFLTQSVCLDDTTVKFEIWDTAGQERYHSLAPMYYRGAQAAIVVYDITNAETFARAKTWVQELQRQASPNIVMMLAGNKADLSGERAVGCEGAQVYADDNSLLFMETSAKTGVNVRDLFLAIALARSACRNEAEILNITLSRSARRAAKKLPKDDRQGSAGGVTGQGPRAGVDLNQPSQAVKGQCCGN